MRRNRRVLLALLAAFAMFAASCGSDDGGETTTTEAVTTTAAPAEETTTTLAVQAPTTTAAADEPDEPAPETTTTTEPAVEITTGGTLVLATGQKGGHVNHGVASGVGVALPSSKIFAALVTLDSNWEPQPYLATDWNISDGGLTVTIDLVEGATFHDGEPITSEDVAYSIQVHQNNHPFTTMLAPVTGFDTSDPHQIVLTLDNPHPALFVALSDVLLPIIPKHIFDDGTPINEIKTHERNSVDVVGSGPFMLTEYDPSSKIVLTKYDGFFQEGKPYLDEIVIDIVPDENTGILGVENGDIDFFVFASALNSQRISENDGLVLDRAQAFGVGATNELQFNLMSEPISDLRVRQAIAYAIDRDYIIENLHQGQTRELLTAIHVDSPFYNPDVERYDVDLDKSRELLAEAGYADGLELTITYIPGPDEHQRNVAEYISLALAEVGITVEVVVNADVPSWVGMFFAPDPEPWDMTMNAYFNWGDPVIGVHRIFLCANAIKSFFVNNSEYCNETVDQILNDAAQEQDFEARKELYAEAQEITAEELPLYFINTLPIFGAIQPDVMNVPTGPWGYLSGMQDVWLDR